MVAQDIEIAQHRRVINPLDLRGSRHNAGRDHYVIKAVGKLGCGHGSTELLLHTSIIESIAEIPHGLAKLFFARYLFGDIELATDFG